MSNVFEASQILFVDDEPDVLSISKLTLQGLMVDGLPLNIQTAAGKAEAIALLNQEKSWASTLAVAFVDVVMETDTAGLELCQYIREEMNNHLTSLYIRTGQPGAAPERAVIDRYDITGYFTKAETTEDKLYSLIKSGIRQFNMIRNTQGALTMLSHFVDAGDSREKLVKTFQTMLERFEGGTQLADRKLYIAVDEQPVIGPAPWNEKSAVALKDRLDQLAGTPLGPNGDKYVKGEDHSLLIKVAPQPNRPEAYLVLARPIPTPDNMAIMLHTFLQSFTTLWARAN